VHSLPESFAGLRGLRRLASRLLSRQSTAPGSAGSEAIRCWNDRVERYGAKSVLNLSHASSDLNQVTASHKASLFPILNSLLVPTDKLVLDFGCGVGRFTGDLAEAVGGRAVGIDVMERLLDLAPRRGNVEYMMMSEGRIPLVDSSVDVVWSCLVLGGIVDRKVLGETLMEMDRVLRPGGLLFAAENISSKPSAPHWIFRSFNEYRRLLDFVDLQQFGSFEDANERISIMAGRKEKGG
jgi:SAM-dependent methyltransferase